MRVEITVKPRSGKTKVEPLGPAHYRVSVREAPHDGEANAAVVAALAEYFGVPKSRVNLVRGHRGRRKCAEIRLE